MDGGSHTCNDGVALSYDDEEGGERDSRLGIATVMVVMMAGDRTKGVKEGKKSGNDDGSDGEPW